MPYISMHIFFKTVRIIWERIFTLKLIQYPLYLVNIINYNIIFRYNIINIFYLFIKFYICTHFSKTIICICKIIIMWYIIFITFYINHKHLLFYSFICICDRMCLKITLCIIYCFILYMC